MKNKGVGVSNWKIIVEPQSNGTNITYGTGWYYVEAGNSVDGLGTLTKSYIINYDERKAVKFDGNKHTMLADGAGIAAGKDYLICNIDPAVIESGSNDFGDGVSFEGYSTDASGNLVNAFTSSSFIFDGIDDKIVIEDSTGVDLSNGFTFSFVGKTNDTSKQGLFSKVRTGIEGIRCVFEYGGIIASLTERGTLTWTWDGDDYSLDDFKIGNIFTGVEEFGMDFVFDPNMSTLSLYKNGDILCEASLDTTHLNASIENLSCNSDFIIGNANWGGISCFFEGEVYSLRLFNKALDSSSIRANYNAVVAYHNILLNGGDGGTGGATGGDSF